jgi:hypothetical protein
MNGGRNDARKLYRVGRTIHRDDCRYAAGGEPWYWADGQSWTHISWTIENSGDRACAVCRPLDARAPRIPPILTAADVREACGIYYNTCAMANGDAFDSRPPWHGDLVDAFDWPGIAASLNRTLEVGR